MMSEGLGKDDLSKVKHLSLCNIHVVDGNVLQFSGLLSQVNESKMTVVSLGWCRWRVWRSPAWDGVESSTATVSSLTWRLTSGPLSRSAEQLSSQLTIRISNLVSLPFKNSVDGEDSRLKRLKLTMIDSVSLTRNIRTFGTNYTMMRSEVDIISNTGEVISQVETVVLHDISLNSEQWNIIKEFVSLENKKLKRLELQQILRIE